MSSVIFANILKTNKTLRRTWCRPRAYRQIYQSSIHNKIVWYIRTYFRVRSRVLSTIYTPVRGKMSVYCYDFDLKIDKTYAQRMTHARTHIRYVFRCTTVVRNVLSHEKTPACAAYHCGMRRTRPRCNRFSRLETVSSFINHYTLWSDTVVLCDETRAYIRLQNTGKC